jgi:hypothetical protein
MTNFTCRYCPDSDLGEIYSDYVQPVVIKKAPFLKRGLMSVLPAVATIITMGMAVIAAWWTIHAWRTVIDRCRAVVDRLLNIDRRRLVIDRRWLHVHRLWLNVDRLLHIHWTVAADYC